MTQSMRWLLHAYVASLNVLAAFGVLASVAYMWMVRPGLGAMFITILCALMLPLPLYAAFINFQSAIELRRIPK